MTNLKSTIDSQGWSEVMEIFDKEILNGTDTKNIKETLSPEHIKLEVMSRNKAHKIVKRALNKIYKIANGAELKEKVIYK